MCTQHILDTDSASNYTPSTAVFSRLFILREIPLETTSKMTLAAMARISSIEMGLIRDRQLRQKALLVLALPRFFRAVSSAIQSEVFGSDTRAVCTYP